MQFTNQQKQYVNKKVRVASLVMIFPLLLLALATVLLVWGLNERSFNQGLSENTWASITFFETEVTGVDRFDYHYRFEFQPSTPRAPVVIERRGSGTGLYVETIFPTTRTFTTIDDEDIWQVRVFYNPENPNENAFAVSFLYEVLLTMAIIVFVLTVLMAGMNFYAIRKVRQKAVKDVMLGRYNKPVKK